MKDNVLYEITGSVPEYILDRFSEKELGNMHVHQLAYRLELLNRRVEWCKRAGFSLAGIFVLMLGFGSLDILDRSIAYGTIIATYMIFAFAVGLFLYIVVDRTLPQIRGIEVHATKLSGLIHDLDPKREGPKDRGRLSPNAIHERLVLFAKELAREESASAKLTFPANPIREIIEQGQKTLAAQNQLHSCWTAAFDVVRATAHSKVYFIQKATGASV